MKVGIIGFGKMGMLHGAIINSLPGVEIVAIADTTKLVLKAFHSLLPKMQYYQSYQKMIDNCSMDAVIITTPSFSHAAIAQYASEHKLDFFIEKPLGVNLEEAEKIYKTVVKNRTKGMVGFSARFYSSFEKGKRAIESNKLGKILSASAENYLSDVMKKGKGWRYNKAISGGGVVIDYSIHMIDLLHWYFGEVRSLTALTKKIYSESVEDEAQAKIQFLNGLQATLNSSWSNPNYRKSYMKVEIVGEKAQLEITDQTYIMTQDGIVVEEYSYPDLYDGYFIDIGGSNFSLQMKAFYDYIANDLPVGSDVKNGLYVQKIVDAIYQSSEKKEKVIIDSGGNSA